MSHDRNRDEPSTPAPKRPWQTPEVIIATIDLTDKTSSFFDSVRTPGGNHYANPVGPS